MGSFIPQTKKVSGDLKQPEKFQLEDNPTLKTLKYKRKLNDLSRLRLHDIASGLLQAVFQRNLNLVLQELDQVRSQGPQKTYEHDLTLAFWFAVHIEDLNITQALLNREFLLKQLVACALINKNGQNEEDEESDNQDWGDNHEENKDDESFRSENLSDEEAKNKDLQHEGGSDDDDLFSDNEEDQPNYAKNHGQQQKQPVQQPPKLPINQNASPEPSTEKKTLGQILAEMKEKKKLEQEAKEREEEQHQNAKALESLGLTEDAIKNTQINDKGELSKVKTAFRQKFQNLMTNVLKIALQKDEEKIACIIIAYYEVALEQDMIIRALTNENYEWLFFTWAFDKNYIGQRNKPDSMLVSFEQLFDLILKNYQEDKSKAETRIKEILDWQVITTNNILRALLVHNLDEIAILYMGFFSHCMDRELFIHCLKQGNTIFLQRALILSAFDKMIFRDESVITSILDIISSGSRTNFLLNVLSLVNINIWKNKHLKELIQIINDYVEENYDKNRLLLSPNPLMSIALAAEVLITIANSRRKFENECSKIRQLLLNLGKMYTSKISNEAYYEKLIMGIDFKGRTVLKTITINNFEDLMDEMDPKAENIMLMIWHGKEAIQCDGNIYGYSNLSHILMTKAKKINKSMGTSTGDSKTQKGRFSYLNMITNFYTPNFRVDYSFQYRYRSKAINFFFYKEFLCALAMLVIFQYINYKYILLFSNSVINVPNDKASSLDKIVNNVRIYVNWNFLALMFSAGLLFQLLLKILFNMCSKNRIGYDKWTIVDSVSAFLNIAAVELIKNVPSDTYLNPQYKDLIDYFMIVVLCIAWIRFFCYFLVIRPISKLILTLIAMIGDTLAFMFIVACFILIMASIFTTLYQDINPAVFGGLAITVRTLFDASLGVYQLQGMGGREVSYSVLMMFHVFFANILLMNYLIAILSTTYDNMKQTGIFKYKVNLYQYCERFMKAFDDRSYGEIVLHPPPVSFLSAMMIPFLVSSVAMRYISKSFSYMMYWLENIFFIIGYLVFEIVIVPLAYLKIWFNFIKNSMGVLNLITNCFIWLCIGIPTILFLAARDLYYLIKILCYHNGCRYGKEDELQEEQIEPKIRVQVYNDTRATVISLYKRLQKHMKQDDENEGDEDEDEDPDLFQIEDDDNMNEDFLYVVKKSLIIDEWKKRRYQLEKESRMIGKNKGFNLGSMMAASFKRHLLKQGDNLTKSVRSSIKKEEMTASQGWGIRNPNNPNQKQVAINSKPKADLTNQLKIVFLDALKKGSDNKDEDNDLEMENYEVPENEINLVDSFLTKFTIVSESSLNEHLDIMLMLKALPNKVTESNLDHIELFKFRIFQEALIAFQNLDIVNAFEYFDDKNRERVQNVKDKMMNQRQNLVDIKEMMETLRLKIERNEEYFQKNKLGAPVSQVNFPQDKTQSSQNFNQKPLNL